MNTETSATDASNVTLGPDWLRSKPVAVFSKYRYGQEELLNLWSCTPQCPQSIMDITDLGTPEPIKPACLSSYQEEGQELYHNRGLSSERGRGRPSGRSRGGGVGRGGTRRAYEPNTRYYENRSTADSDNWRRRDPDPVPEPHLDVPDPVPVFEADQPPSYPPFPSKSFSPTHIDNRETNSWKRTENDQRISPTQPPQRVSPPQLPQRVSPLQPPQQVSPPQSHQRVSPPQPPVEPPSPPHHPDMLQFSTTMPGVADNFKVAAAEESPETMLKNISKSLYDVDQGSKTEPFNSHVMFSPFSDSQGGGNAGSVDIPQLSSCSTTAATPTSPPQIDMPPLFNRDAMSPQVSYTSVQPSSTQHTTSPQQSYATPPPFPSLADIGKSLNNHAGEREIMGGQGFLPPPPPAAAAAAAAQHQSAPPPCLTTCLTTTPPSLTTTCVRIPYRADEMWFYLDPKNNTQGPFDSVKMFGWFKEGYFGMDLKIRRSADTSFTKLETIIQQCGRIPFQPEDKPSPPAGTHNLATSQLGHVTPSTAAPAWNTVTSIWGNTENSNNFGLSTNYREDQKVQRAEDMRREIERAMALEQQRKQDLEDEKRQNAELEKDSFLLAQRQMMEAKLLEEQKQTEEQLKRLREEEIKKSQLFEEEAEKIRLEKERLEQERMRQAEKVRIELEAAERARQALEQERLKLERERQLVKQKEEELRERDEAERKKREEQARVAEERRAAQQAAAEAKAIAKAQEEAAAAAIKEARRQAEERAPRREDMTGREGAAANRREQDSVWGATRVAYSPTAQENTNPWANIPQTNITKSTVRTAVPTSKGWAKPDSGPVSVPLSQIQQDEVKMKSSVGVVAGHNRDTKMQVVESVVSRPTTWATARHPTAKMRSLADIQREEERRTAQQNNYAYAQDHSWNPVAGMLEDEPFAPKPTPKKQTKPQQAQPQQKAQNKKGKTQQPLIDMFSTSSPKDEFTVWCESQVSSFKNQHIDVPTFISFLRDVESPREVREYVVSYLGDTLSTDKFIQEFVARRKSSQQTGGAGGGSGTQSQVNNSNNNKGSSGSAQQQQQQQQQQSSSRRGKRKKMQKVNAASLLGINCTASSDARNRGDIDTVVIQ